MEICWASTAMKSSREMYAFRSGYSKHVFAARRMLSQPVNWGGKKLSLEYSAIDTRYSGTKLYVSDTQEVGITIGTNRTLSLAQLFARRG